MKKKDIIIIGGGLTGVSLALALSKLNLSIALVEASEKSQLSHQNDKAIAIAQSSKIILDTIGIWSLLESTSCPIKQIHVSDKNHFGITRICSEQEKVPALGYVVSANQMSIVLNKLLQQNTQIEIFSPVQFVSMQEKDSNNVKVTFKKNEKNFSLVTKLVVACDGQNSSVREQQKIPVKIIDYHQYALFCLLTLKRSHHNVAYERFTSLGPFAILPMLNQTAAVIWSVNKEQAQSLLQLSDVEFLQQLQKNFGYRLGKFLQVSKRTVFPLKLIFAQELIRKGLVLVGNAAHTPHPVAGQGLNLGLRDVAFLAEEIASALMANLDFANWSTLDKYQQRRQQDQQQVISFTHQLVNIFSNSFPPLVLSRNTGLLCIDILSQLKKMLAQRAMGFTSQLPRMACGLSLETTR